MQVAYCTVAYLLLSMLRYKTPSLIPVTASSWHCNSKPCA